MSYHVIQNPQQRTLGVFIVIAFHVLLIWALASGLGNAIKTAFTPDPIKVAQIKNPVTPPTPVDPIEPVVTTKKFTFDPTTPTFNIPTDTAPVAFTKEPVEVITTSGLSKPKLIKASKPEYPLSASRLGEEGATGLELYITPEGRVGDVKVYSPSGSTRLDEAAVKHAKRNWSFSACTEGGKAVGCWFKTKLVWRLEDAAR
ncbi:MAG: energy transducer TonB [Gammaproteobacteria bacterium]|nr:MAG: energy transducer TonB [Gammaproteobacteria bacterium]